MLKSKKKVPAVKVAPAAPSTFASSYHAARRGEENKLKQLVRENRLLKVFLGVSLVSMTILGYGLAEAAGREIPVVRVDVDRFGRVVAASDVGPLPAPGPAVVEAAVRDLIVDLRRIYLDPVAQADYHVAARAKLVGPALTFTEQYFAENRNNPFILGAEYQRRVDITSVLPRPDGKTWEVEWRETLVPHTTGTATQTSWKGLVSFVHSPGKTYEQIVANPYGIYFPGLTWAQVSAAQEIPMPKKKSND